MLSWVHTFFMLSDWLPSAMALTKRVKGSSKPTFQLSQLSQYRRTRFHLYFAMESWLFENSFKNSNLVMRISVSKEKRSVDQVWRIGNWAEKKFRSLFLVSVSLKFSSCWQLDSKSSTAKLFNKIWWFAYSFPKESDSSKKISGYRRIFFGLTSFTYLMHPIKRCTKLAVLLKKQRATKRHQNSIHYRDRTLLNIVSQ